MFPVPAQGNLIKSPVQNIPNHSPPGWEGSAACVILHGTASPSPQQMPRAPESQGHTRSHPVPTIIEAAERAYKPQSFKRILHTC